MSVDDRRYNYRKNPSLFHKIRVIMGSKKNPQQYGVTIPKLIAEKFIDCKLVISTSGNCIVLESGCSAYANEVKDKLVEDSNRIEIGSII